MHPVRKRNSTILFMAFALGFGLNAELLKSNAKGKMIVISDYVLLIVV